MNRTERIQRWTEIITGIVTDYQRLDAACDAAHKAGTMDPSGPLYDAIWRAWGCLLDRFDEGGWISWFIYDNDGGKKGLRARTSKAGKPVAIRTPRQLAGMIVKHQNEKQP